MVEKTRMMWPLPEGQKVLSVKIR